MAEFRSQLRVAAFKDKSWIRFTNEGLINQEVLRGTLEGDLA